MLVAQGCITTVAAVLAAHGIRVRLSSGFKPSTELNELNNIIIWHEMKTEVYPIFKTIKVSRCCRDPQHESWKELRGGPWCISGFVAFWHRSSFQTGVIFLLWLLSWDSILPSPGMLLQLLLVTEKLCYVTEWETCSALEHALIFHPSFKYSFVSNFYCKQLLHLC